MKLQTKQKIGRVLAVYIAVNMLAGYLLPVRLHALTSGPSQPEFQSFTPAGSSQMVNPFSGDFSYNIPLMTVPGPNGGYPINLAYNAGVGLEDEASWVGLGWSLNAGEISRNVRGLPDDFKADEVIQEEGRRPNENLTVMYRASQTQSQDTGEVFGFDLDKGGVGRASLLLSWDNYQGYGGALGLSLATGEAKKNSPPFARSLDFSMGTDDGISFIPSVSYQYQGDKALKMFQNPTIRAGISTRQGIYSLSLGTTSSLSHTKDLENGGKRSLGLVGSAGISFSRNSYIPHYDWPTTGTIHRFNVEVGEFETVKTHNPSRTAMLNASHSLQDYVANQRVVKGYGYLYQEHYHGTDPDKYMLDFNREKNTPVSKKTPSLPVPVATYDSYSIKGQGIGGAFRAYRSDIGIYSSNECNSLAHGLKGNLEFSTDNTSTRIHIGLGGQYSHSKSYSGTWRKGATPIAAMDFKGAGDSPADERYEPFYFKTAGELNTGDNVWHSAMLDDKAVRFTLESFLDDDNSSDVSFSPKIKDDQVSTGAYATSSSVSLSSFKKRSRVSRVQDIRYRSGNDIVKNTAEYSARPKHLYLDGKYPGNAPVSGDNYAYDYTGVTGHHMAEMTVANADGSRYIYGLPVYNNKQVDAVFSVDGIAENDFPATVSMTSSDATAGSNDNGFRHYVHKTTLPKYVTNYLLTQVCSPDYVDVTGNGPTEDDLGYYTKINYTKQSGSYKWRSPYAYDQAHYNKGNISDVLDDVASYSYGEREVYYLNSIETKTHVAVFVLNTDTRADAKSALGETPSSYGTAVNSRYLKEIRLYSKKDMNTVLKTVVFTYDYSLCLGVPNGTSNGGKLTLKEVYVKNLGNDKGSLSPFKFTYAYNPSYSANAQDRWGTFRAHLNTTQYPSNIWTNNENPYVMQGDADGDGLVETEIQNSVFDDGDLYTEDDDLDLLNQQAAAWNLSKIELPSGGTIDIEYEADDYGYVENKRAMQMCRLVGFSRTNETSPGDINSLMNSTNLRVYFELSRPIPKNTWTAAEKQAEIDKYVDGISQLYFKAFMRLKGQFGAPGDKAWDYVSGFADFSGTAGVADAQSTDDVHRYGYLDLSAVNLVQSSSVPSVHPFRKAGFQYLKLERPDLFNDQTAASVPNPSLSTIIGNVTGIFQEIPRIMGFNASSYAMNYCNDISVSETADNGGILYFPPNYTANVFTGKPSFIRLNSPSYKKKGGGHRVKKITSTDGWEAMTSNAEGDYEYGQEYRYENPDGSSSGVCSYEPLVGGDEIPHHLPVPYKEATSLTNNEELYQVEPLCEAFMPGAGVGYGRVEVRSLDRGTGVTLARTGVSVTEFYTAKDFPAIMEPTDVQKTNFMLPLNVPFIGPVSWNNKGYSQGYSVVLNDMHGRLKSQAVYPFSADNIKATAIPTGKTEYIYNTDPANSAKLSNSVTVLSGDANYSTADLGVMQDFYVDLVEHSNRTWAIGAEFNLELFNPGYALNMLPDLEYVNSLFRSVVTMKVIYRTGIVSEVRTFADGAWSSAKNLMYDAETGAPLLTQVYNNFDKPVYTYNYAGHWSHPRMGGAWNNVGSQFDGLTTNSSHEMPLSNASSYFVLGDEVEYIDSGGDRETFWVDNISSTGVHLIDAGGNEIGTGLAGDFYIRRSGYRNQQAATDGVIVSLSNPVTARYFPLFDDNNGGGWNNYFASNAFATSVTDLYKDCVTGELRDINMSWNSGTGTLAFGDGTAQCEASLVFPAGHGISSSADLDNYNFYFLGNGQVRAELRSNPTVYFICTWTDSNGCYISCLDDVLHASATRFGDDWDFDYTDLGMLPGAMNASTTNDYREGRKGIFRTESNYLYQVDRKQESTSASKTNIAKDGTYKHFVLYDWGLTPEKNKYWSFVSDATKYNPYGYALESRDALGTRSAVLYGYDQTKQTAAAANCDYYELAFDGFEDYPNATYPELISVPFGTLWGHGHLKFAPSSGNLTVSSDHAHTGTKSMLVPWGITASMTTTVNSTSSDYFRATAGERYQFSAWVYANKNSRPKVSVTIGTTTVDHFTEQFRDPIEGWRRIDFDFTAPASGTVTIAMVNTSTAEGSFDMYCDDIRIQPFTSAMVSYVYDPLTHWLLAQLDNRNYATIYAYDEEGAIIQVRQETEKGILTTQTGRSNIKR